MSDADADLWREWASNAPASALRFFGFTDEECRDILGGRRGGAELHLELEGPGEYEVTIHQYRDDD